MINIGICDDNITLLEKYRTLLEMISKEEQLEVSLHRFTDGNDVIAFFEQDAAALDVLFLDILMPGCNGIDTARKLRDAHSRVVLIFLTSSEEYIFDSMDLHALGYMMKDQLTKETMRKTLRSAVDKVMKRREDAFEFQKDGGSYQLSYQDICFIKNYKGYCYLHHWDGIIFENADTQLLNNLNEENFFKVHEQYIINLQYVGKIEKQQVVLSDHSRNVIPLDKRYAGELKIRFAKFMMEKL